jgi:hypothetical protein
MPKPWYLLLFMCVHLSILGSLQTQNVNVSCATSNMANLIVGDLKGTVRVLNSDFTLASRFTAYSESVKFLAYNMENNCLVNNCLTNLTHLGNGWT